MSTKAVPETWILHFKTALPVPQARGPDSTGLQNEPKNPFFPNKRARVLTNT